MAWTLSIKERKLETEGRLRYQCLRVDGGTIILGNQIIRQRASQKLVSTHSRQDYHLLITRSDYAVQNVYLYFQKLLAELDVEYIVAPYSAAAQVCHSGFFLAEQC